MIKATLRITRVLYKATSVLRTASFAFLLFCGDAFAEEQLWKAGLARTMITPETPVWLAGYGGAARPASGKATDLWIKVLALEDAHGQRAVILTSDTLGIPQSIYTNVVQSLKSQFNLSAEQIMLTASHTHCGPILRGALYDMYPIDNVQREHIEKYSTDLEEKIIDTCGKALAQLSPAVLVIGQGKAGFGVNRRNNQEAAVPKLISAGQLKGPVDHSVPVLAVYGTNGDLKSTLFGYACHNTTMSFSNWCGDYAGYAQIALEKSHPGATAMFFMGCGADINPLPRRKIELAERYGNMLAAAVEEVLRTPHKKVPAKLGTAMEIVSLRLEPPPPEAELQKMIASENTTERRWASRLLAESKAGKELIRAYPYPVQAWKFGDSQLLISLGGEVVVDYSLKFKQMHGSNTWVAAYCNDVMSYIPSLRVLKEGGYEGSRAMIVYGMPSLRYTDDIEEVITSAVDRLIAKVRKQ